MNLPEWRCGACGRRFTDPRHDHPHDYCGSVEDFNARKPCLACGRVHDAQPDEENHEQAS